MELSPRGAIPAAPGFGALLAAVRERRRQAPPAIGRVSGPARLAVTAAWARVSGGPVILLTADATRLLPAAADLETLLAALGAPHRVLRLPGFPVNPYAGVAPHPETLALRAVALFALAGAGDPPPVVVASAAGALWRTADPVRMRTAAVQVRIGDTGSPAALAERLVGAGYRYEDPVSSPGDFARRGGIVDLFPVDRDRPLRIEFGFEGIESLRDFEVETQRSVGAPGAAAALFPPASEWCGGEEDSGLHAAFRLPGTPGFGSTLAEYADGAEVLIEEPDGFEEAVDAETRRIWEARAAVRGELPAGAAAPQALTADPDAFRRRWSEPPPRGATGLGELAASGGGLDLPSRPAGSFRNRIPEFLDSLTRPGDARRAVHVFVPGDAAAGRFRTRAIEAGARVGAPGESPASDPAAGAAPPRVFVHPGRLSAGFEMPGLGLEVLSGAAMLATPPRPPRRRSGAASFRSDFRDLKPGDPVVHTDHGVGLFVGMKRMEGGEDAPEFVQIRYRGGGTLFLPVERLDLLEKYSAGSSAGPPALDRLGGTAWVRRKQRVSKAMRNIARELIRLYAERREAPGRAFCVDPPGLREFEDGFEWTETADQARVIREVFADMEAPNPMDRLLAGDVGFGKTEVALRAAYKAAMDGTQVAVLAPTTVLASQHFRLFEARFEPFPVRVELLSRFRTPKQQKQVVAGLRDGTVDIVIGTHRLLSKDVGFRELGLLVVDEEQRFGVSAKEKLKRLTVGVDHLAMTATPIPRTLNLSLSGIRDLSVIETPPRDRMAIQTHVLPFDPDRIAEAVRRELAREGQVYFVHNRVRSLPAMEKLLARIVPEARVLTAHGQMRETALERALLRFQEGEADILLSTTIIENGIDLPRVNTLLVNRADAFGLAQLYQIRGRVGRSSRRAYAYLLVPTGAALSDRARPRLAALREFSELGAGFRVAALDMELRGAGNLLGAAQHGHLEAVGFDLYYRLLEEAVAEARGAAPRSRCAMQLRFQLRIPRSWISDERRRMWLYKRCSAAPDLGTLDRLEAEVRDRFGNPPEPVGLLFEHMRLRLRAEALGYTAVRREGGTLSFEAEGRDDRRFRAPVAPDAGPLGVLRSLAMALEVVEAAARTRGKAGPAGSEAVQ